MKKFVSKNRGLTITASLIGIGITIFLAFNGMLFSKASQNERDLRDVESEVAGVSQTAAVSQSRLENVEEDVSEIKGDVKEVLRRLSK